MLQGTEGRCECGELAELHECEFCRKLHCKPCFDGAAEEVKGGMNVGNTGWNCCYECAQDNKVQIDILTEARKVALKRVKKTGEREHLREWFKRRRELKAAEQKATIEKLKVIVK